MVGNACAAGWNIGASLEMTQDPVNKFLFTWIGQLSAGELKFPLDTPSDWNCDLLWLLPRTSLLLTHELSREPVLIPSGRSFLAKRVNIRLQLIHIT